MAAFLVTQESMIGWGPFPKDNGRVLIYSIGAFDEAHSPALPRDIDDYMARRMALTVSERTGFYFKGHLPYCGDRVGLIAKDWCPSYMDAEDVIDGVVSDIRHDVWIYKEKFKISPTNIMIVSGHGGNNFLKAQEEHFSDSVGVPVHYFSPFEGITIVHEKIGELNATHADIAEHSVACYLGLLNQEGLNTINKMAEKDPAAALTQWPSMAGLGGYRLFGGKRYEALRNSKYNFTEAAERFLQQRKMIVEFDLGKRFFEAHINNLLLAVDRFRVGTR